MLSVLLGVNVDTMVTNAKTNATFIRKRAVQYPWVHACKPKELNPSTKANGFLGSRPIIFNAPGVEVSIPALTHKGLYTKLSYHPAKGHARSSTICAKGNGFLGSRPVISNVPGRGMSMPHKLQDWLSFAMSEHNDSCVSL